MQQDSINYSKSTTVRPDKKKGRAQEIDVLIGERLKAVRKQRFLTQEDLADKLGISFQQIQKYENGKNRISFGRVYELSLYLQVPLDSFVSGVEKASMSDNKQAGFIGASGKDIVSEKETNELLKVYYSLEAPKLRKDLLKFIKTMAKSMNT